MSNKRFRIVTLCGSTRYKDEFMKVAERLTLEGNVVLGPCVFTKSPDSNTIEPSDDMLQRLEEVHFAKIDMSDEIFVVNKDGYIGDGTLKEIQYAVDHNKLVRFLNPSVVIHGVSIYID